MNRCACSHRWIMCSGFRGQQWTAGPPLTPVTSPPGFVFIIPPLRLVDLSKLFQEYANKESQCWTTTAVGCCPPPPLTLRFVFDGFSWNVVQTFMVLKFNVRLTFVDSGQICRLQLNGFLWHLHIRVSMKTSCHNSIVWPLIWPGIEPAPSRPAHLLRIKLGLRKEENLCIKIMHCPPTSTLTSNYSEYWKV